MGKCRKALHELACYCSSSSTLLWHMLPCMWLRPLSELICSFFNDHKAGARTQRAFSGLILQLRKILQDKSGGMQHVKKQLLIAIEKSEMGEKKWSSITYENWERFGKQKTPAWQINNRPSTQAVTTIFEEDAASDLQF